MKEIRGQAKNIRSLLANAKYSIDYFQREYRWEKKQVGEAMDDLTRTALSREQDDERRGKAGHDKYFLGTIIVSDSDGKRFVTDGQQRLTTITLLLIALYQRLPDGEQRAALKQLIYSYRDGATSFNLDIRERHACMKALLRRGSLKTIESRSPSLA